MKRIVVTGGIASGKSTFAQLLGKKGGKIIDYDQISRSVLEPNSVGLAAVEKEFGRKFIDSTGKLKREALAELVFSNSDALLKLNAITHPLIEATAKAQELQYVKADPHSIVIHDIPLYIGSWLEKEPNFSVLVCAPEAIRISRMVNERAMSEAEARARISMQYDEAKIAAHVDLSINNSGLMNDLDDAAELAWAKIISLDEL